MEDGDCNVKPSSLADTSKEYDSESGFTFQLAPSLQMSPHSPPPSLKHISPLPNMLVADPKSAEDVPAQPTNKGCHTLNAFFVKVTAEEKAEADKREFEELKIKQEMNFERAEKEKRKKLLNTREKAKARQQAFHDHRKAKKKEAGETSEQGKVSESNYSNGP